MENVNNIKDLHKIMLSCEQSLGVSVFKHGQLVVDAYSQILKIKNKEAPVPHGWRIPDWLYDSHIHPFDFDTIMLPYLLWHDCGKPFCLTVDESGKRHFPGHADKSAEIWRRVSSNEYTEQIATLMSMDMDAHVLKADGVTEFSSRLEAPSLLMSALAETHANAVMFGGLDSDSFKIKTSNLNKRGRQILELIKKKAPELSM